MDNKHTFEVRKKCLEYLRDIGYQVGTGVMIGLPNQTEEDLVNDILFYKDMNIDMIGMGPYILHKDTPLGQEWKDIVVSEEKRVELGLKMIAITRIFLKDVNIAATTALQGLDPQGREKGLLAGANILMPTATALEHKNKYLLYDNKPGINDSVEKAKEIIFSLQHFSLFFDYIIIDSYYVTYNRILYYLKVLDVFLSLLFHYQ